MPKEEISIHNLSGGMLSPLLNGRFDLAVVRNGLSRIENWFNQTQGGAQYRPGTAFVNHTRLNKIANPIRFQFNDIQAYMMEFTDQKIRFYRNSSFITESTKTITAITKADPAVITTSTSHGYAVGDEIFVDGVVGMTEVNGKTFLVGAVTATTIDITDIDSVDIDSTGFTTYTSAGTTARIFELDTPYTEANDLFALDFTQTADTMYFTHPFYEPRKLTRTDHTAWTLSLFTRTNDPFTDKKNISAITQADPAVVTTATHGYSTNDVVIIEAVVGMEEVNSQPYKITVLSGTTFELNDLDGNSIDSTGFGAWSSAGYASNQDLLPKATAFHESRLFYGGQVGFPDRFYGSRSPDSTTAAPRFDDFTTGANADHAIENAISDTEVNIIEWFTGTDRMLFTGTFGSEVRLTGTTEDVAMTPTSVSAKPLNQEGVSPVLPINKFNTVLYVARNELVINQLLLNEVSQSFTPSDLTLVSDRITESGVKQLAWSSGRINILWAILNDGKMLGLTYDPRERIAAWHFHTTGVSKEDKFIGVTTVPRPSAFDQTWMIVERVIDGNTRRYVEFFTDFATFPREGDFFTGVGNRVADKAKYLLALAEAQKEYIHLDSSLSYDGKDIGTAAAATMTPGATTGNTITFTAGAAVFTSDMVGREIWKQAIDGVGTGRAEIVTFTNTTTVVCNILDDFDNTDAIPAGKWYLTAGTLSNLDHLEGRVVTIVTDGGVHPDKTVTNGAVTLDYQSSRFHVGLAYEGFMETMDLEFGGASGPSQTKNRHVHQVGIRFLESLGLEIGTDIYNPELVTETASPLRVGDPAELFTGVRNVSIPDSWDGEKTVFIKQNKPLPANVQLLLIHGETDDD